MAASGIGTIVTIAHSGMAAMKSLTTAAPDGCDRPIETVKNCHELVRTHCSTLRWLALHLKTAGCDAHARNAASELIEFFGVVGRQHHEDEEKDLFPAVLASATGANFERASMLVQLLEGEHRALEHAWTALCRELEKVAQGARIKLDEGEIESFNEAYRTHSALEDNELIPLALVVLSDPELAMVGHSMAQRHGTAGELHPA
jgi:hemerythrin-like domain-containing protein